MLDLGADGSIEQRVRADRKGLFRLGVNVDYGNTLIKAIASRPGSKRAVATISVDRPTSPVSALQPKPMGSMRVNITGIVMDFDFHPVSGALVDLYNPEDPWGGPIAQTTTDAQGNFLIQVTEGSDTTWHVGARGPGARLRYEIVSTTVPFEDGAERTLTLNFFINPNYGY
jgi:hypothetical protein